MYRFDVIIPRRSRLNAATLYPDITPTTINRYFFLRGDFNLIFGTDDLYRFFRQ